MTTTTTSIASESEWIDLLDVSAAQGTIDWARVAAAEVAPGVNRRWRGVIAKLAEAETHKDPTRLANINGARAAGLGFGGYLFLHPMGDMERQVQNAYEALGDTMPSYALAIDLEAADPSLTAQQIIDQARRARDAALYRWFGRLPILYGYPDFTARRMQPALSLALDLAELTYWGAFYGAGLPWYPKLRDVPRPPAPFKRMSLWQYSGNTKKVHGSWLGHVDGINGDVDRNVYLLGEEAFAYDFCGRPRPEQLLSESPVVRPTVTWTLPTDRDVD